MPTAPSRASPAPSTDRLRPVPNRSARAGVPVRGRTVSPVIGVARLRGRSEAGLSSLEWLLLAAASAAFVSGTRWDYCRSAFVSGVVRPTVCAAELFAL